LRISDFTNNDPGDSTACVNLVIDVKDLAETAPGLPTHDYALADDNLVSAHASMREEVVVYSCRVDAGCHRDAAATRDERRTGQHEESVHSLARDKDQVFGVHHFSRKYLGCTV
jgi:hypothetical protein